MIRSYWEKLSGKVDDLSLRERVLVFSAIAFLLVSLVNSLLLDPLLTQQKRLSEQIVQQQEKMKDMRAQMDALMQAMKNDQNSPQRRQLKQVQQQLADGEEYLQGRKDRLVAPEQMSELLQQVLNSNGKLQLVSLETLPVAPLLDQAQVAETGGPAPVNSGKQVPLSAEDEIYKHGVQITVRGSYLDMLGYLAALEHLQTQMFWGQVRMNVVKYPVAELTLTVYTLSLGKTWLQL